MFLFDRGNEFIYRYERERERERERYLSEWFISNTPTGDKRCCYSFDRKFS